MNRLVFSLACFLIVACGSSKNKQKDPQMEAAETAEIRPVHVEFNNEPAPLQAIFEMRAVDGGAKVGMVYKRDHGKGRVVYWVYDATGMRRGFVTPDNRAFAYDIVLGKRSGKAHFIGEDTLTASTRRVSGSTRAVRLVEIDIDTWARQGTGAGSGTGSGTSEK